MNKWLNARVCTFMSMQASVVAVSNAGGHLTIPRVPISACMYVLQRVLLGSQYDIAVVI